jgi:hypothetical protein
MIANKALSELVDLLTAENTQEILEGVLLDNPGFEQELNAKIEAARSTMSPGNQSEK